MIEEINDLIERVNLVIDDVNGIENKSKKFKSKNYYKVLFGEHIYNDEMPDFENDKTIKEYIKKCDAGIKLYQNKIDTIDKVINDKKRRLKFLDFFGGKKCFLKNIIKFKKR